MSDVKRYTLFFIRRNFQQQRALQSVPNLNLIGFEIPSLTSQRCRCLIPARYRDAQIVDRQFSTNVFLVSGSYSRFFIASTSVTYLDYASFCLTQL
jgi:hypothetical protein